MHILVYSPVPSGFEEQLMRGLEAILARENIHTCRSVEELSAGLRRPGDVPAASVFVAPTREDLKRLLALQDCGDSTRIVLILPDAHEETIRMGHLLGPRFLSYADGDLTQVLAVLERMLRSSRAAGGEPPAEERLRANGGRR